jgi:hypothetical protein
MPRDLAGECVDVVDAREQTDRERYALRRTRAAYGNGCAGSVGAAQRDVELTMTTRLEDQTCVGNNLDATLGTGRGQSPAGWWALR